MTELSALGQAALTYAKQGIPVFPLVGKKPLTEHGFKDATVDPASILQRWALYPDANIGTPTGIHIDAVTGKPNANPFDVLDSDVRHRGPKTLSRLIAEHGELPSTPTQTTGTDGTHYCFWSNGTLRNSDGDIGPGLDIRGTGGYIVLAPSIHPDTGRPYRWNDGHTLQDLTLAVMPTWITQRLRQAKHANAEPGQRIPLGVREATIMRMLGTMRRQGATETEMLAVARVMSRERCDPPVAERDLQRMAKSCARYAPEPLPKSASPGHTQTIHRVRVA
jgi:Bifunctional DNA primase/polymerase, N-terminal/Primase C terminal 1 (PriCT-1)